MQITPFQLQLWERAGSGRRSDEDGGTSNMDATDSTLSSESRPEPARSHRGLIVLMAIVTKPDQVRTIFAVYPP